MLDVISGIILSAVAQYKIFLKNAKYSNAQKYVNFRLFVNSNLSDNILSPDKIVKFSKTRFLKCVQTDAVLNWLFVSRTELTRLNLHPPTVRNGLSKMRQY